MQQLQKVCLVVVVVWTIAVLVLELRTFLGSKEEMALRSDSGAGRGISNWVW